MKINMWWSKLILGLAVTNKSMFGKYKYEKPKFADAYAS